MEESPSITVLVLGGHLLRDSAVGSLSYRGRVRAFEETLRCAASYGAHGSGALTKGIPPNRSRRPTLLLPRTPVR